MGFWDSLKKANDVFTAPGRWIGHQIGLGEDDPSTGDRAKLNQQTDAAGNFANTGEAGFAKTGAEAEASRQYLRDLAEGKNSVSAEQLRQGMQQNVSAQRSMAASAAPGNAAMAARTAAVQGARAGYGMSGQAAIAGLQERAQAQQMLNDMILKQRQQELEASLQSRGNAINGLNGTIANPQKSWFEKYGPAMSSVGALAASDKRLKHEIKDADDDSRAVIDGLKAYSFKYKDSKHGEGSQFGVMAQDLERAGLKHAVIDTPAGKMVHGAKLATSNTAMIATLGKRIAELESKGR